MGESCSTNCQAAKTGVRTELDSGLLVKIPVGEPAPQSAFRPDELRGACDGCELQCELPDNTVLDRRLMLLQQIV